MTTKTKFCHFAIKIDFHDEVLPLEQISSLIYFLILVYKNDWSYHPQALFIRFITKKLTTFGDESEDESK